MSYFTTGAIVFAIASMICLILARTIPAEQQAIVEDIVGLLVLILLAIPLLGIAGLITLVSHDTPTDIRFSSRLKQGDEPAPAEVEEEVAEVPEPEEPSSDMLWMRLDDVDPYHHRYSKN